MPLHNPYHLSIDSLVRTFRGIGGQLPSTMAPTDLHNPKQFFKRVEEAAGAAGMEELAAIAQTSTDSAFGNHLHMLRDQTELPVIAACYLGVHMVGALRSQLLNSPPGRS
jgi:hypothetical protein